MQRPDSRRRRAAVAAILDAVATLDDEELARLAARLAGPAAARDAATGLGSPADPILWPASAGPVAESTVARLGCRVVDRAYLVLGPGWTARDTGRGIWCSDRNRDGRIFVRRDVAGAADLVILCAAFADARFGDGAAAECA